MTTVVPFRTRFGRGGENVDIDARVGDTWGDLIQRAELAFGRHIDKAFFEGERLLLWKRFTEAQASELPKTHGVMVLLGDPLGAHEDESDESVSEAVAIATHTTTFKATDGRKVPALVIAGASWASLIRTLEGAFGQPVKRLFIHTGGELIVLNDFSGVIQQHDADVMLGENTVHVVLAPLAAAAGGRYRAAYSLYRY